MKRQRTQRKLKLDHSAIRELKEHDFPRIDGGVVSDSPVSFSITGIIVSHPNC